MTAAFIGGLFVGTLIGMVIAALCVAARTDDDEPQPAPIDFPPLSEACEHGVRWDRPCALCEKGAA